MKTNKFIGIATLLIGVGIMGCAPSAKQLKEAVESDPSIVFAAIEKDPAKFIEVVNKAAQAAQEKAQAQAAEDANKKRDEEFANPLKPVVEEGRVIFGKKDAPVTIVEYSDFECPYCARGFGSVQQVLKEYPDKVRVVFKHLPLDFHPMAMPSAKYFEAVGMQSHEKAEKFHDAIFENQAELRNGKENFLKATAKKLGLDMKKLEKDLADAKIMERIQADTAEAGQFGFHGTPGFIINGVSLKGAYPFSEFKLIIDKHLATATK